VDASQNVGIGTTSPVGLYGTNFTLYSSQNTGTVASNAYGVIQSVNRNAVMELVGTSTATNAFNFSSTTPGTGVVAGVIGDIANQAIFFRTGGLTERLRIDSSGRLLIGTSSASGSNLLQVNSDALIYGLTVGRGAGAVYNNTVVGSSALASGSQAGGSIVAVGYNTLQNNTTASYNTGVGYYALNLTTTGGNNTAIGASALASNTTASNNTAVGYQAGYSNTTGTQNTAVGYQALRANTTENASTAVGYNALGASTARNDAFGYSALAATTTGAYNAAFGFAALYANTTGGNNTAVGYTALNNNTTASNNTAVGYSSGSSITTGAKNVILGSYTGAAAPISATGSNFIVLSDGDGNVRQVIDSSGNVGIGTTSPGYKLDVQSTASSGAPLLANFQSAGGDTQVYVYNGTVKTQLTADNTNSASIVGSFSAHPLIIRTSNTERMRIDTSSNVGIGTSSPSTFVNSQGVTLVVGGNGSNFATIQGRTDGPTGATNGVAYGGSYSTNPINGSRMTLNAEGGSGQRGSVSFWTKALDDNSTQPLERMRIDQSGNLLFNSGYGSVAKAYGCRAWCQYNGSQAIVGSANITSITVNATGDSTLNFTTAMPDANYSAVASTNEDSGTAKFCNITQPSTTTIRVVTFNTAGTKINNTYNFVAIFR
jgi:hypothetical protein